jgi:hypothetical protein
MYTHSPSLSLSLTLPPFLCTKTHTYTYMHTHTPQITAMREGFISVVPALVLPLYTWRQIEMRICGNAEIDVDALKRICEFAMPGGDKHPVAVMFWNVVKTFSNDERAALLGFVSGRRRLPGGGFFYSCVWILFFCLCGGLLCACFTYAYACMYVRIHVCNKEHTVV